MFWIILTTAGLVAGSLLVLIPVSFLTKIMWRGYFKWSIGAYSLIDIKDFQTVIFDVRPAWEIFLYDFFAMLVIASMLTIFQWLALRTKGVRFKKWFPWSTAGFILPYLIRFLYQVWYFSKYGTVFTAANPALLDNVFMTVTLLAMCLSPGICQWTAIRKALKHSGWWIAATTVGWILFTLHFIFPFDGLGIDGAVLISKIDFWKIIFKLCLWKDFLFQFCYPGEGSIFDLLWGNKYPYYSLRCLEDNLFIIIWGYMLGLFSGIAYVLLPRKEAP